MYVCRSKHVEQLRNIGIIISTTQLHLVGYFYMIFIMMNRSMNIKFKNLFICLFVCLFIHSVTQVTLDTPVTDYNLYIATSLIIYEHLPDIIQ